MKSITEIADSKDNINLRHVVLLICHSCNLNCKYCYESYKSSKKMSISTCKSILEKEFATLSKASDGLSISFLGGEPFLNWELIVAVSEWLWSSNIINTYYLDITTNGTILSNGMRKWLIANKKRIDVTLSIDGFGKSQIINRTAKYIDVDFFIDNWPHRQVNMVLFPDSISLMCDAIEEMLKRKVRLNVSISEGVMWDDESVLEYERLLGNLIKYFVDDPLEGRRSGLYLNLEHCFSDVPENLPLCNYANTNTVCYDADGVSYPCHMVTPLVLGDKTKRYNFLAENFSTYPLNGECRKCIIFHICKPCPAMNLKIMNDIFKNAALATVCKLRKIQARQSAILYCRYVELMVRKGAELDSIERMLLNKSISVLKLIPEARAL